MELKHNIEDTKMPFYIKIVSPRAFVSLCLPFFVVFTPSERIDIKKDG